MQSPLGTDVTGPVTLGRYTLLSKIASGGMGEVYLARFAGEGGFEKLVAIKRLLPELVASEEFVTMFVNEARIAAQLSHTNICDIYELGHIDNQYFIAMQYLEGVPLSRIAGAAFTAEDRVRLVTGLGEQACEGLHHAHELRDVGGRPYQLVHRDVSPSNLFATFDGVVKVLDFGIAKARGVPSMTSKGSIRGKFAYMSPEQIRGDEIDRRSDVFSLGVCLFEALTTRRLFERPSEYLVAKAILEDAYPRAHEVEPAVPEALSRVLARAMARDAADRYATANAMGVALRQSLAGSGGPLVTADIGARLREEFAADLAAQRGAYEEATEQLAAPGSPFERRTESAPIAAVPPAAHATGTPATRDLRVPEVIEATEISAPPAMEEHRRKASAWLVPAVALVVAAVAAALWWRGGREASSGVERATDSRAVAAVAVDAGALARDVEESPDAAASGAAMARVVEVAVDAGTGTARRPRPRPSTPAPRRHDEDRHEDRTPGILSVDSEPYATIYIDGKKAGVTPFIGHRLPPGRYKVRAELKDGRTRTFPVHIRAGKTARHNLRW